MNSWKVFSLAGITDYKHDWKTIKIICNTDSRMTDGGKMTIEGLKRNLNAFLAVISAGFTILLILIAFYALVCSFRERNNGTPFFLFGWKPVIVLSDSMEPTYSSGEILLIREKDETPKVNDIIMFKQRNYGMNAYVTHRIIGQDKKGFITKGDANKAEDPGRIPEEDVIGTVKYILF